MNFTNEKTGIVLASLRHFQRDIERGEDLSYLSDITDPDKLNHHAIDAICEDINLEAPTKRNITSINEWFESVRDSEAFIVNGFACSDFSFPSPDDGMDDSYSFYVYGANGCSSEILLYPEDVESMRMENDREVICDISDGSTYTFQALS